MKKIKVCFIGYYSYKLFNEKSKITFGGNEVLFYLISEELAKDNQFNVNFILEDDVNKNSQTEIVNNITLYKTSRNLGYQQTRDLQIIFLTKLYNQLAKKFPLLWQLPHLDFFRLWDLFKKVKADIYILGSADYEVGLVSYLASILNKKFLFLVGHDEDINGHYINQNGILGKSYEHGLKNAHAIWCSSKRHQKMLKKNYQRSSTYLPYWYPIEKKSLTFVQRSHILWVARLQAWKRPEIFLKIASSLPKEKFIMIASLAHQDLQLFKDIQNQAKKVNNLTFIKNVPFSKVTQYYKKAKLFIETSDYGSMHTSHLQSAVMGTPCLTFYQDPNNSFKKYKWGLIAKGDYKTMLKNINLALTDKKLWQQMSTNAVHFAKTTHNIDTNIKNFKKLLLKLSVN